MKIKIPECRLPNDVDRLTNKDWPTGGKRSFIIHVNFPKEHDEHEASVLSVGLA